MKKPDSETILIYFGIVLFVVLNIIMVLVPEKQESEYERYKVTHQKYKGTELKKEDSLCGRITLVTNLPRCNLYVRVDDTIKATLYGYNRFQEPNDIREIIAVNDSIIKECNSELYYLIHEEKKYMFHITNRIE